MTDTEELRAASRALKDAITGLSKALGQGLADVGADVGREIATELNAATEELSREIAGATAGARERKAARTAKAEQTRTDLLVAAAKVFAEHGYEAASVADLAKAAGYTKGALYAHFASKEDLFFTLIDAANAQSEAGVDDPTVPFEHPIVKDRLTDTLLSLEAYLYGLRHPQTRERFGQVVHKQLDNLGRRVRYTRTGSVGEPTRDDLETAMGLAMLWTMGGIMDKLLEPEWDVAGAFDRLADRLTGGAPKP